jgi:hypothetical protein
LYESPVADRLQKHAFRSINRLWIQVSNESDKEIAHVRVNARRVDSLWSAQMSGTYVAPMESKAFEDGLSLTPDGRLIFPELPVLPPHSKLEFLIFGNITGGYYGGVDVSAPVRSQTIEFVTLERTWWVRNKDVISGALIPLSLLVLLLLSVGFRAWHEARQESRI